MQKNKWYIVLFVSLLLAACSDSPDIDVVVHECAPMPSPRASATCCVVGGKAYVFGGRDKDSTLLNDLWRYTPETDRWENLGTTPLSPRVHPTSCVQDNKIYIGLGYNGGSIYDTTSYKTDFWEYTPATQQWKRLRDYPNHYTDDATAFTGEGELYIGYGFFRNYRRDMFRYSITDDRWDSIDVKVSMHGYPTRSFGGTGCTCQQRHFMGTGFYRRSLDWWAELVDGTHWEERTPVSGRTRTLAASTASENYIYVSAGFHHGGVNTTGEVLRDIRRYDPLTDKWTYVAILPEGIINHISFAIGKRVFFGLGETEDWKVTDRVYYVEE